MQRRPTAVHSHGEGGGGGRALGDSALPEMEAVRVEQVEGGEEEAKEDGAGEDAQ